MIDQRRAVDGAASKAHADPASAGKAFVQRRVRQRVHEHRHAERGCGGERRARLLVAQQEIAPAALHEHAAKLEFLDRASEFAGGGVAVEGVDGGKAVELAGMLADEFGHRVVDALFGAGRDVAVGVLDEGGRRVDDARGDAGAFDRREQGVRALQVAVGRLPGRPCRGRQLGQIGERPRTGPCSGCGSRRSSAARRLAAATSLAAAQRSCCATPAPSAPRNPRREVSLVDVHRRPPRDGQALDGPPFGKSTPNSAP